MSQSEPGHPKSPVSMPKQARPTEVYPEIEALVAAGEFKVINASFKEMHGKLDHIIKESSGFGRGSQAKKAMKSLELTVDLLRHLLQVKETLAKQAREAATKPAAAGGRKV